MTSQSHPYTHLRRVCAVAAANQELLRDYWEIGAEILRRQQQEGWGAKAIDHLAADLRIEFPDVNGFSSRSLKYMRAFAAAWPNRPFDKAALHKQLAPDTEDDGLAHSRRAAVSAVRSALAVFRHECEPDHPRRPFATRRRVGDLQYRSESPLPADRLKTSTR